MTAFFRENVTKLTFKLHCKSRVSLQTDSPAALAHQKTKSNLCKRTKNS